MPDKKQNTPVRVLFVDHTAQLGGGEIALRNLLHHLDCDKVHIEVLLFADGPLAQQLRPHYPVHVLGLPSHIAETRKDSLRLGSLMRFGTIFAAVAHAFRIARFIRASGADIVHTNSLKSHLIGGVAARLARRPVIWHLRDRIAPDYLPRTAVHLVRWLSRILPSRIIANSQATLNTIIERKSGSRIQTLEARTKVVHDGCMIPSVPLTPTSDRPVKVGLIGRVSPWKGQHVFLRAVALIKDEFQDVKFQIIGAPLFSETDYHTGLKSLVRELKIESQVEFLGFVEDVGHAIAELHIVVHASTVPEPFGQVVIEGMAAGKPVVATRGGGVLEIVEDSITGLLIPMNDEHALAEAISTFLRDHRKAQEMGMRGRERVMNCFSIQRTARAIEQIYCDLLSEHRPTTDALQPVPARGMDS